jgi:hypothetical protein
MKTCDERMKNRIRWRDFLKRYLEVLNLRQEDVHAG